MKIEPEIISRDAARSAGLKRYFLGRKCKNGHEAVRLVSNGCCVQCLRIATDKHRDSEANREKLRQQNCERMRRYRSNPDWVAVRNIRRKEIRKTPEGKRQQRNHDLKARMGITLDQFERTLEAQKYCCAICSKSLRGLSWRRMCADHDHKTGEFRAVLCPACNTGIGLFKDNPALLKSAIDYLHKHSRHTR